MLKHGLILGGKGNQTLSLHQTKYNVASPIHNAVYLIYIYSSYIYSTHLHQNLHQDPKHSNISLITVSWLTVTTKRTPRAQPTKIIAYKSNLGEQESQRHDHDPQYTCFLRFQGNIQTVPKFLH